MYTYCVYSTHTLYISICLPAVQSYTIQREVINPPNPVKNGNFVCLLACFSGR